MHVSLTHKTDKPWPFPLTYLFDTKRHDGSKLYGTKNITMDTWLSMEVGMWRLGERIRSDQG